MRQENDISNVNEYTNEDVEPPRSEIEPNSSANDVVINNEPEGVEAVLEENSAIERRVLSRSNKGVISRLAMDMGGKDYRTYTSKQMAQVLHKHKFDRRTKKSKVTLMMRQIRSEYPSHHQFFQIVVNILFLSPQMSARKGIKQFGERAIVAMIKEFRQLDAGAFPGKPVVEPVAYKDLTEEEIRMAMEAIS